MKLKMSKYKSLSLHMLFQIVFVVISLAVFVECKNKYSADANTENADAKGKLDLAYFRNLQKPFRMAKINMLWNKAQKRLTESKLKSLFSELKIHDKEELTWKKLKTDGADKDGLKEAEMRKKLTGIMSTYDLLEHFEDVHDPKKLKEHRAFNDAQDEHLNKLVFKDKKLNKLWHKAERSGFTAAELKTLHEEFSHHQEKVEQYHSLLGDLESDISANTIAEDLDAFNELENSETKEKIYLGKANIVREHHKEVIDSYDKLDRMTATGPTSKEFVEPKVHGLWRIATQANFTPQELESLRVELRHYESRLLKLRHLQVESEMKREKYSSDDKQSEAELLHQDKIKKQARKIEKLHFDLEARIMQKHVEL